MIYKTQNHRRRSIRLKNYDYSLPDRIITINDRRGDVTSPLRNPTLGQIIAHFKYQSTKRITIQNTLALKFTVLHSVRSKMFIALVL